MLPPDPGSRQCNNPPGHAQEGASSWTLDYLLQPNGEMVSKVKMSSKELVQLLEEKKNALLLVKGVASSSDNASLSEEERKVPDSLRELLDGRPEPAITLESSKTGADKQMDKKVLRCLFFRAPEALRLQKLC